MAFLTREQLLAINDLLPTIETVPGPAGQGEVGIRVMTAGEREDFLDYMAQHRDENMKRWKQRLCVLTLCDEAGGRLFSLDEVETLAGKTDDFIERVFEAARRINKLDPDTEETTKKNFGTTPDAASGTDSPATLADVASPNGSAS